METCAHAKAALVATAQVVLRDAYRIELPLVAVVLEALGTDGAPVQIRLPVARSRHQGRPLRELILDAAGKAPGPLRGKDLARECGCEATPHFRALLAELLGEGALRKVPGGYRLAGE